MQKNYDHPTPLNPLFSDSIILIILPILCDFHILHGTWNLIVEECWSYFEATLLSYQDSSLEKV